MHDAGCEIQDPGYIGKKNGPVFCTGPVELVIELKVYGIVIVQVPKGLNGLPFFVRSTETSMNFLEVPAVVFKANPSRRK